MENLSATSSTTVTPAAVSSAPATKTVITNNNVLAPSKPYQIASLVVLLLGLVCYAIGLYNADMELNEKGYYLVVLLYGLFATVSLQKHLRDEKEGIKTSRIYSNICWFSSAIAIALLILGLYNAELYLSEKGFYGMAYILTLYAAITVQKNHRDHDFYQADSTES
ncbi:MAG: inner membrane protein YiaA [Thalassotalea sp.]